MLKAIALAGFFFAASAITAPAGASPKPVKAPTSTGSSTAPATQAFCPTFHC